MRELSFGGVPVRPLPSRKTRKLADYSARQQRRNVIGGGNRRARASSIHGPAGGGRLGW